MATKLNHRIIALLLATCSLTGLAQAQDAVPAPSASAPAAQAQTGTATTVDETALRYFARQGDERRLQAEIARLSAIYPGWTPPSDPLANDSGIDNELQAMWDLYGQGDLAGVEAAIEARKTAEPGWAPPADLLGALASGSAAAEIRSSAVVQDYAMVLKQAANHQDLLTCDNVDLLWTVAEAFVDTGREPRGVDTYSYILGNCTAPDARLATMQKARVLLSDEDLQTLFQYEKDGEFAPIRLDQARQSVADYLSGVTRRVDASIVATLEETARTEPTVGDLRLLGYFELANDRPRRARDWFARAVELDGTSESVAGLALAMADLRELPEAEELLAERRFDTPELEKQYLDVANALLAGEPPRRLEPEVLERIIDAIDDAKDYTAASTLGWYAYNFGQTQTAARWFEESLEYNSTYEPAAYGLLVANQKLRNRDRVREIIREWGPVSPRIELFGKPGAPTTAPEGADEPPMAPILAPAVFRMGAQPAFILAAQQTPAQKRAAAQCGTFVPPESFSPAQALGRGWCLMDLERPAEAEPAFRRATQSPSVDTRTEAYYGLTLALLRLGLIEEAAVSAAAMPQTAERVHEMQIAILASTAVTYFDIGRYDEVLQILDQRATLAPEQNDLLTIRAWSYYHLGRKREARQIFAAVAATGYKDAQAGLDALNASGFQ